LFPTLAGAASAQSRQPDSLLHVVLAGAHSASTAGAPTTPAMPPFGWLLNDEQIASVATYVRTARGNAGSAVTGGEVRKKLAQTRQ
jgi:mono/diheme cytochrome c family protein